MPFLFAGAHAPRVQEQGGRGREVDHGARLRRLPHRILGELFVDVPHAPSHIYCIIRSVYIQIYIDRWIDRSWRLPHRLLGELVVYAACSRTLNSIIRYVYKQR